MWHNALFITLNLYKNLRLRIAIVCSAWIQLNIPSNINSLLWSGIENFPTCAVNDIVNGNGLILILAQRRGLQSVKQDREIFRFYKQYNNLIRDQLFQKHCWMTDEKERLALSKEHLKHDADSIKIPVCVLDRHWVTTNRQRCCEKCTYIQ